MIKASKDEFEHDKLFSVAPCWRLGSVGVNVSKMLQLFKTGHEYMVESDCYIRTQIGMVRIRMQPHGDSFARSVQNSHISSALHSWTCLKNIFMPTWKPSW